MRELVIALRESDNSEEYEHIEVLEQFSMSVWIGVHGVRRYLNSTKQWTLMVYVLCCRYATPEYFLKQSV
jgi:hypothetical protein